MTKPILDIGQKKSETLLPMTDGWIGWVLGIAFAAALAVWIKRSLERSIEKRLVDLSAKAIQGNLEAILALAGNTLEEKSRHIHEALAGNEKSIERMVSEI